MMNIVVFKALVTYTLFSTAAAVNATTAKCDAKSNKGFAMEECGKAGGLKCCHPKQEKCVTATPWAAKGSGSDKVSVCSKNRALFGMKAVKVVMIPMSCEVIVVILLIHMALKFKFMKSAGMKLPLVNMLCFAQVLLGCFVMLTEVWKFGVYDAFLSILVFHATLNHKTLPNWAFGIVVLFQIGNLVAIMGPAMGTTDGVFLPLGLLAADGGTVSFGKKGMLDHLVPDSCTTYFHDYFKLESIEMTVEGHDPKVTTWGLCHDEFVATVVTMLSVKMVFWFIMTALSAQMFALKLMNQGGAPTRLLPPPCPPPKNV